MHIAKVHRDKVCGEGGVNMEATDGHGRRVDMCSLLFLPTTVPPQH